VTGTVFQLALPPLPPTLATFWDFRLVPERASSMAASVDHLYIGLIALTAFFSILIGGLLIYFAVKYRAGSRASREDPTTRAGRHEFVWITVPSLISVGIFLWASHVYFAERRIPADTIDVYVVAKQWMWKLQHASGQEEINELHVPVNRAVKLIMTSQDVIHSFYVPAFRVKQDVLPGRHTDMWFEPTRVGEYHLFCAEYCGADHSRMIGRIVVMTEGDYQAWLTSGNAGRTTMAGAGNTTFVRLKCGTCHVPESDARAPQLAGLFGREVKLTDGTTHKADEQYIRRSIHDPRAQVVAGYQPVMPTFKGQVEASDLNELIAYIKSLKPASAGEAAASAAAVTRGGTP
jgi:cytochrome c oxidase subunit 2